jgi:hypothetical protein
VNLAACGSLASGSLPGALFPTAGVTWWRAIPGRYYGGSLRSAHTARSNTRFNPGSSAAPTHPILYLADDPVTALLEVGGLLGHPWVPGGVPGSLLSHPAASFSLVQVTVRLNNITNLTDGRVQAALRSSAQELTGDWQGFRLRGTPTPTLVPTALSPVGTAPTQDLGLALVSTPNLERFVTYSARVPYRLVLVVFPHKLDPASSLVASDGDHL